jgi:hypothetical protein
MFACGTLIYLRTSHARDRIGRHAFWSLIVFLAVIYVANLTSPPPPSDRAVAWADILGTLLLFAWAQWAERHRQPVTR